MSEAVLEMVFEVAQGMIQSGRYSPRAEKIVETCLPSTKSENADEVGVAEYEPMAQVIKVSVMVTTGLFVGIMGATCDLPVTDPEPDA